MSSQRAMRSIVVVVGREFSLPGFRVRVLLGEASFQLNSFVLNTVVQGIPENALLCCPNNMSVCVRFHCLSDRI